MNSCPNGIVLEKPARNLESLVQCDSLTRLKATLVQEWLVRSTFADVEQYGIRPTNIALFHGPPGNGKTVAAKLIAKTIGVPLFRVACESLINSYVGQTESNMAIALDWLAKQGASVVLFDECEAIFKSRARSNESARGIVGAMQVFWQRLDRWDSPQLFCLATNMLGELDPAVVSRVECQIEFVAPTREQSQLVVEYWSEILHEYGAAAWGPALLSRLADGWLPASFRDLWNTIRDDVRARIVQGAAT